MGPTAIFILEKYKTAENIAKLKLREIKEIESFAKRVLDTNHISKLVQLAKNTVGSSTSVNAIEFNISLDNHRLIASQIEIVEL